MTALAFLVRHRTVDLVVASAQSALRNALGMGPQLLELRRDDLFAVEAQGDSAADDWVEPCLARVDWFNPNKHRFGLYESAPGCCAAAVGEGSWPHPWLQRRVASDRPDLAAAAASGGIEDWLGLGDHGAGYAVMLAAWYREDAMGFLPRGSWPSSGARLLRAQLWTLAVDAPDAEAARELAESAAVTRWRRQGLLIHPHMERWARVGPPRALSEVAS